MKNEIVYQELVSKTTTELYTVVTLEIIEM
jgi:hypothetical protein